MAAKILSRLFAPLMMLVAACQVSTGEEPGTSESFSTDTIPGEDPNVPESSSSDTVSGEAPSDELFAWQCEGIAEEVAYCESELPLWDPEADIATACAPADSAAALACCNAFGGDHCAVACEAGDVLGAGDLVELEGYLGDGLDSATSRVVATCAGATEADLLTTETTASSELLGSYGLDSWGEATARPVDEIGGLFLMGFDEARRMLDELGHDDEVLAWSFDRQVGTDEGEFFLTKWVFLYPATGVVIVLEGAIGFV